jgi:putative aldouronate transport system permease protein
MVKDNSLSSKILDIIVFTIMTIMVVITLYPILNVVASSLSSAAANNRAAVTFYPIEFTLEPYKMIFESGTVPKALMNSLFYTATAVVVNLLMTGSLAYALSRKQLYLRNFYTWLIIITMYVSGGMIPSFILVTKLGLYNSFWALILPGAIGTSNLIIMRTFFQNIPKELEESAYIDGANDFQIFWQIVLPLSKAAIFTIGLYYAVGMWNSWFSALMYLKDNSKYPLPMILRQIVINSQSMQDVASSTDISNINENGVVNLIGVKFATLTISIIPMLIIYPFVQKHFTKGVMIGSLKG